MSRIATAVLVAFVVAGCGASAPERAPGPATPAPELYAASATVLQKRSGTPMLCLGAIAASLPPQCGDVPVEGWDWDAVEGEEMYGGTRWGDYRVVGTYDGETFAVRDVGADAEPPSDEPGRLEPACPEPEGGWDVRDPAAPSQEDVGAAEAYATAQPEYVASWVFNLLEPGRPVEDQREDLIPVVYNAVFAGNAERHEEELRERWDGPLCVVERDLPTRREADRIRAKAEASLDGLGLRMLWSSEGGLEEAAEIGVVADPGGEGQAALDGAFGEGVVRLVPALRPVG